MSALGTGQSMTDGNPPEVRPSATLILLQEDPQLKTLMVQRGAETGYAAHALVFPGGKVDEADYAHARLLGLKEEPILIAAIAAIRETFEETGLVLIARNGETLHSQDDPEIFTKIMTERAAVVENAAHFGDVLKAHGVRPDLEALTYFSRWRTPPNIPKRFETWFFVAKAPASQQAAPDGIECLSAIWEMPGRLLEMREEKKAKLIFPTARTLELLGQHETFIDVREDAHQRDIPCIEPKVIERDGEAFLTIPEGLGYPICAESLEKTTRG